MTHRIFDIDNEEDMKLLWSILPEQVFKITKQTYNDTHDLLWYNNGETSKSPFGINWHDKTEITRPVNYESMIGCVGWFWDNNDEYTVKKEDKLLGILGKPEENSKFFYDIFSGFGYDNFTPAKKSELKFWGE